MRVPKIYSVVLNGSNVTTAIASSIIGCNYTDVFSAGASTLELDILTGSPVVPVPGDFVEIKFGYEDTPGTLVNTGTMRLDNIVRTFRPNTTKVGAIAWDYWSSSNTSGQNITSTNVGLNFIVASGASNLGLTLDPLPNPLPSTIIGTTPNVGTGTDNFVKVTGSEGWLNFLKNIARDYGYLIQAKGGILSFRRYNNLKAAAAISTIPLTAIAPNPIFTINYAGLFGKTLITTRSGTQTTYTDLSVPSGLLSTKTFNEYYESTAATLARAEGVFMDSARAITGLLRIPGSVIYQASQNVNLSGFTADFNKKWMLSKVVHDLSAFGWTTDLYLQLIG